METHDDFAGCAADFPDPFRLLIRPTSTSTNEELRQLALAGAPAGLVLLALQQTAGRGRRGTPWLAPPAASLTFSILLRPHHPQPLWSRLALAAGLAVAETVEALGAPAGIKWPNDVWIAQRKVAGILVEAGTGFVIVGIGLNVNTTGFPAEIADIATSVFLHTQRHHPRDAVLAAVINHFAHRQAQLDEDFHDLLAAVRQRCVLTGQQVSLTVAGQPRQGTIEGLAADGQLLLRTPAGLESLIQADEIRLVPATPPSCL